MRKTEFFRTLQNAQAYTNAAIMQLDDAQTTAEFHQLTPKHRRLLSTTHTNLKRHKRILESLIEHTLALPNTQPPLPAFLTPPRHTDIVLTNPPSPHTNQPNHPE